MKRSKIVKTDKNNILCCGIIGKETLCQFYSKFVLFDVTLFLINKLL